MTRRGTPAAARSRGSGPDPTTVVPVSERRTGRAPGGSRRPGRRGAGRASGRVRPGATGSVPAVAAVPERRRPRLTGRAAVLVLVVAVLTVSYASSLRAYLQQRAHISDLKQQIALRAASIDELEREKRRWDDPAFVRAQARERFGFLMPGETSYVVLGEDGEPLEPEATLPRKSEALREARPAWYDDAWESVVLAGDPPAPTPPAATDIKAP